MKLPIGSKKSMKGNLEHNKYFRKYLFNIFSPKKPEVTEEDIDYVSKVKQLCDKKKWIQASFEDSGAEGPSHDRVFYVTCHLPRFDIYTQGSGKSKKLAKKVAAFNLLRRLEEDNLLDIDNEVR